MALVLGNGPGSSSRLDPWFRSFQFAVSSSLTTELQIPAPCPCSTPATLRFCLVYLPSHCLLLIHCGFDSVLSLLSLSFSTTNFNCIDSISYPAQLPAARDLISADSRQSRVSHSTSQGEKGNSNSSDLDRGHVPRKQPRRSAERRCPFHRKGARGEAAARVGKSFPSHRVIALNYNQCPFLPAQLPSLQNLTRQRPPQLPS